MDKDGAAVQDGQHELYIYKCEDSQKLENCGYLSLPAYSKDYEGNHDITGQFSRSHKEAVFVKTLLCSTKLTQNGKVFFLHNFIRNETFSFSLCQLKANHQEIKNSFLVGRNFYPNNLFIINCFRM